MATPAGGEELAAHYIARVHQLAHSMQFVSLNLGRPFQSERARLKEIDRRREALAVEIDTLNTLAKELVPDPVTYAEVANLAVQRAADVACSQCYGRIFLPEERGTQPRYGYGGPVQGSDGRRYYRCSASHDVPRDAVPPL
jgi:hypothetical protein